MQTSSFLIFGFGYLGRPLAEALHQQGFPVRAVKRRLTSDDVMLPIDLDTVDLSVYSEHPAWPHYRTWILLLPPSQVNAYVETMAHLIRLAERSAVQHLIFAGSISVYGNQPRVCDEDSERLPETESAHQIVAVEQLLRDSTIPHRDILHLGGLYSATRHPIFRLLSRGRITGSEQPVNMLHQDRAVAALLQAALHPDGLRIRNVVETPHLSKRAFYAREAAKLGCTVPDFDAADQDGRGKTVITRYAQAFGAAAADQPE